MFLSRDRPRPVSVSFFLNPHSPLSLSVCFSPFRFIFPFLCPHSLSPIYGFPGFLSFFRLFSSLPFVPFSPFLFYFSSSSSRAGVEGIYRAKGSGGVPIATLWQRLGSRALLPCHSAGLAGQWAELAGHDSLDFSSWECMGGRVSAGHAASRV